MSQKDEQVPVHEIYYKTPCGQSVHLGNVLIGADENETLFCLNAPMITLKQINHIQELVKMELNAKNEAGN